MITDTIPVEIAAVLKAARAIVEGKVIAVVQPHRFTRVAHLFDGFCTCFNDADIVLVADIYAAGEAPIEGVTREAVVAGLIEHGHRNVRPLADPQDLAPLVSELARPGDMVVCLGAGSITNWANNLPANLRGCSRRAVPHDSAAEKPASALIAQLPPVRGRLTAECADRQADLVRRRRFGGSHVPARRRRDLAAFLAALPAGIPVTVIGVGSNLLVRDGGIPGVTIRLGRGLASVAIGHEEVRAGAGALDRIVAFAAAEAGLAGLEFLSGIPGTIGGSLRMNAGAYGAEIKQVLVSATALDRSGRSHTIDCDGMQLSYRHCGVDPGWIFIEARLRGAAGDRDVIKRRLAEIRASREATQPVRARTGGSTFTNPPGEAAWRLIDAAGCRGLVRGGAMVSPKHVNFLINTGSATAADLEGLGEEVRRRVFEITGIVLEWEIHRIGVPAPGFATVAQDAPGASSGTLEPSAARVHHSSRSRQEG